MEIQKFGVIFLLFISCIHAQTDILSLSSFQSCASVDSRYFNPSTANNQTTYINCSTDTDSLPTVTVVDMRLEPGIGAGDSLVFNITVVPDNINNNDPSSTTTNECDVSDPETQVCRTTSTAVINVVSTKIVYKYTLQKTLFTFPYCYGSVALFEQYKNVKESCKQVCTLDTTECEQYGVTSCLPIQYSYDPTLVMIKNKLNTLKSNSNGETFKISTFKRVQQPYNRTPLQCTNFNSNVLNVAEAISANGCAPLINFPNIGGREFALSFQGNLRNITTPYADTQCPPYVDPSVTYCRKTLSGANQTSYDNPNVDVRIPSFLPMPSVFGMTPKPMTRNLIDDPVEYAEDVIEPVNVTNIDSTLGSISYGCVGYSCGANQDLRRIEEVESNIFQETSYLNTINSIVSLGPQGILYSIVPEPEVFAEVTVNVTINGHTETLVINNFDASGSATSSPYRFVFGRIENIQTPNFIIGPSISGGIMLYGQEGTRSFINMQCLIDGVTCDDDQKVNSSGFSETTNPWDSIMKNAQTDFGGKRTNFYPHPYDYVKGDVSTNGKTSDKYLPGDHGQTFWHYVNLTALTNQFGSDCNMIGQASGANSAQQNANLYCNLPAHSCLPGLGTQVNGGLKTALGCRVSQFMNLASGLYDGSAIPFPYGDGVANSETTDFFLNLMKTSALPFMPTNRFLTQNTTGGGTIKSLYDPTNPQFWLGYGNGGQGGTYLYYSPTTSDAQEYQTNIAVELVLDIVGGTFLQYEDSVAKSTIDTALSQCQLIQGGSAEVYVYVTNPVQSSVLDQPTSYDLFLNCNNNVDSNILFDTLVNPISVSLNPGESKYVNFTVLEESNNLPSINQIECVATLQYQTLAAAISDEKAINCGFSFNIYNASIYNPGGVTPNNFNNQTVKCTGFCNLSCYINAGEAWKSGCFWLIVIVPILIVLGVIATIISYIVLRGKYETARINISNKSQNFINQEQKNIQDQIIAEKET